MIEVEPFAPTSDAFSYFTVIWGLVKVLWPFLIIAIAILVIPYLFERHRLRRLALSGIFEIDHMDGKTFEEFLGELFRRKGYAVELTPYRGDWGADLILVAYGVRTVVQAKRYSKPVGVRAVQEAVAAGAKYGCTEFMIVTNATFTRQAVELARVNRVQLWDREKLVSELINDRKTLAISVA